MEKEEEAKYHPLTRFALWRSLVKILNIATSYVSRVFRARRELNGLATPSSCPSTGTALDPRPHVQRVGVPVRISPHKVG